MSQTLRLAVPAVIVSALLGCGGTPAAPAGPTTCEIAATPAPLVGTRLATVNGNEVGTVGWEALSARKTPANGTSWTDEEKRAILDEVLADEALFQEAFDRALYQDPKVRKIMVSLLLRSEVYDKVRNEDFTDEQMEAHFRANKAEFVVPEKVQVKRIFVAINSNRTAEAAKTIADGLYAKVTAQPDSFRDVAIESSDGPFARRGGDVGYIDREGKPGLPPDVVARAFLIEEGGFSQPFEAAGGYNILYVPQRRERIERSFEQMRGAVLRRLKNERYEELTNSFVDGLLSKGKVEIDDAALAGWNPASSARTGTQLPRPPQRPAAVEEPVIGEDGKPIEMVHGHPKTGDPFQDMGDANDEAERMFQEDAEMPE